ncbi:MAG TPA: SbcC/MukB-like Walker B domain-containing protein, partial [Kineosporiaceae bacterium]|nr:SbcC/MukB-like Walker B domain-containing protein [Kineosporiaceae bacterium]
GDAPDQAREAAEKACRAVRTAQEASARAAALEEQLRHSAAARDAAEARCAEAAARREQAHTRLARLEERLGVVMRRLEAARAGHPSVTARREHAHRSAAAAEALLTARREVRSATQHLAEVTDAARAAAVDAGFADIDAARDAVLAPAELARHEQLHRAYVQERAVVEAGLADPDVVAAGDEPPAQPVALATARELAQEADEAAAAALDRCRAAAAALAGLEADLAAHLAAAEPLRGRHRLWSELSRCLDGTGGDNTLRMSLSSYVLAARLEQVAAAASQRLLAMSSGRYSLEHCDEAGRGRGRSGLSLRVVDGWTGRHRDTASLSGGESFYTSLALALGLADVVTAEAGGATIETLFVDEGFGSLDEETLQEVMDTLDGLRSGGRVVGLVSHLPDLRERIPTRLEVVKTRSGSTVRQASA